MDIFSKSLGQIQNLDPDHLMSALKSRPLQATLSQLGDTPIEAWIQKMACSTIHPGRRLPLEPGIGIRQQIDCHMVQ